MRFWFEGGAAPGNETVVVPPGNVAPPGNGTFTMPDDFDFGTVLPEDLKGNKSLEKFSAHKGKAWAENVARSLVSAQGMIGADPNELVRVPVDPTKITAEDRTKFLSRLGLPKDEKAYTLKAPEKGVVEGMEPDSPMGQWFSKAAQAQGLFPDQAQALYGDYVEQMRANVAQQNALFANVDKTNIETLQKELGKAFDGEVKAAAFGAKKLGGEEFVKRIGDMGLGTDPVFLKAMAKYGRAMAEGSQGGDKGDPFSTGISPAQAQAEGTRLLQEAMNIMDSNPAKARELNLKAQEVFARGTAL